MPQTNQAGVVGPGYRRAMEKPRKLKLAIIILSITLSVSLGLLAWTLWQNYWWRRSVDLLAEEAGSSWAMRSFRRGQLTIWQTDPTNDSPRFTGHRDGPFEVWLDGYHDGPVPWRYAERKKLEAHNRQMRYMYEHPQRFRPEGAATNTIPTNEEK